MKAPDIWLQPDEDRGKADCGCVLKRGHQNTDDPAFSFCPLHQAAGELLEELQGLVGIVLDVAGNRTDAIMEVDDPMILAAQKAIRKAEGRSK